MTPRTSGCGPRVSVITPSYNYADLLPLAVRSVACADHPVPVEHIVIDDGSTDGSWEVLRSLAESHQLIVARHENRGLSATLNAALELAHGDWIVWLNADDLHLPWTYRLFAEAVQRADGADIVFGDTVFIDAANRVQRLVAQPQFDPRILRGGYNMFHNCSVFWRRGLLPQWRFDVSMKLLMDLDLWLEATSRATVIAKVDAPMSAFRRHPGQVSASKRASDREELMMLAGKYHLGPRRSARATIASTVRHAVLKRLEGASLRERAAAELNGRDAANLRTSDLDSAHVEYRVWRSRSFQGQGRG